MNLIKNLTVITLAATIGYGCSSSGGGSTATTPDGIYSGNITGGSTSFNGIEEKGIIYNNRLMVLSRQTSGVSQTFDANLTITAASFIGVGSRYDDTTLINTIGYDGAFVTGTSSSINFAATGINTNNLTSGNISLTASAELFSKGSSASRLDGSWSGVYSSSFDNQMLITINNAGIISGGDQAPADCIFTGTIIPADTSVNVYNVILNSDGGSSDTSCRLAQGEYTGLAWTEGDNNKSLVLMVASDVGVRSVILTQD